MDDVGNTTTIYGTAANVLRVMSARRMTRDSLLHRDHEPSMQQLSDKLTVFGTHDEHTLRQAAAVAARADRMAVMADGHYGYVMPVGGVAAYRNHVSVNGVGFDIACGVAAVRTDRTLADLGDRRALAALGREIDATISFGMGRKNAADDAPVDHPLFEDPAWSAIPKPHREKLRQKARAQLGTVGSGNHFVDLLVSEDGAVWVMAHFGSRGLGHTIASAFLSLAQGGPWDGRAKEAEVLLDLATPMGEDYWALMSLAGQYAYAGREWVVEKVASLFGAAGTRLVHQHHNAAWRETHDLGEGPEEVVVVRKGATPAFPGQAGAVGGSMGDDSVILRGAAVPHDSPVAATQRAALFSTVHGAGRVMSRTAAAGKRNRRTGEIITPGRVTPEMMAEWLERAGVVLVGGGLDESPHAYRRLTDVIAAQGPTVEVEHVLRPVLVVMAGADEADPYKD